MEGEPGDEGDRDGQMKSCEKDSTGRGVSFGKRRHSSSSLVSHDDKVIVKCGDILKLTC